MTFVDTGGWFSYFVRSDPDHDAVVAWITANQQPLFTTDYVIDETLTLLRARGENRKAIEFGTDVFSGQLAIVHAITPADVAAPGMCSPALPTRVGASPIARARS